MAEAHITGILPARQLSRGVDRPVEPGISRRKALVGALAGTAVSVAALALPISAALVRRREPKRLPQRVAKAQMHQIAQVLA